MESELTKKLFLFSIHLFSTEPARLFLLLATEATLALPAGRNYNWPGHLIYCCVHLPFILRQLHNDNRSERIASPACDRALSPRPSLVRGSTCFRQHDCATTPVSLPMTFPPFGCNDILLLFYIQCGSRARATHPPPLHLPSLCHVCTEKKAHTGFRAGIQEAAMAGQTVTWWSLD